MKKILLSLFLAGSLLTSCDMDTTPDGSIQLEGGIQKMADVKAQRNGLYSALRSRCGGSYTALSDLQTDIFIGTMQNGNYYTAFTNGNLQSNDGDILGFWTAPYSGIMQVNYFLEAVEKFNKEFETTDEQKAELARFEAEAYFMRAYYNYMLMYYFCGNYDAATANTAATGIPIVTKYIPSELRDTYPGRSTLAETYTQIEKDIDAAISGLEAWEVNDKSALNAMGGGGYLNSYAAKALKSRVALMKGDYATAENVSKEIIESQMFPLTAFDEYENMWKNDTGDELIFQPYGDASQRGSVPAPGSIYFGVSPATVGWVPSANVLASYSNYDIRLYAFTAEMDVNYNGTAYLSPVFYKYPGNTTFNSGNTNAQKNLPKPFRTAEQYLILAEAAYNLGHEADANDALNELRAARIMNYQDSRYSGVALMEQIKTERVKELIGEGFRLGDLRRWKQGFDGRDGNYAKAGYDLDGFLINMAMDIKYTSTDYRYVWPIPSAEMVVNPQLKGQQNPGYGN
ncbi:RagB/SusD family nutrient uptake outer membrane protein [uncultured Duncaniella sp.]|uniref:RagB/SusD family nutrient uptake outer membrane protein n=1 Tax=uncultured Duncaniella sp. TaxID=2768039 RepID=UPI00262C4AE8|nr:RagB/SusD family nutrient uptake outer membrane protein [uncultured Duncaniella sp.]